MDLQLERPGFMEHPKQCQTLQRSSDLISRTKLSGLSNSRVPKSQFTNASQISQYHHHTGLLLVHATFYEDQLGSSRHNVLAQGHSLSEQPLPPSLPVTGRGQNEQDDPGTASERLFWEMIASLLFTLCQPKHLLQEEATNIILLQGGALEIDDQNLVYLTYTYRGPKDACKKCTPDYLVMNVLFQKEIIFKQL